MSYREFTWAKAKQDFGLQTVEGGPFIKDIPAIQPTTLLAGTLTCNIPWAIAVGNEKARSEGIINPILLDVDLTDYPVPPLETVLSMLVWIVQQSQE